GPSDPARRSRWPRRRDPRDLRACLWLRLRLHASQNLRLSMPRAPRLAVWGYSRFGRPNAVCYAAYMLPALIVGALTAWYLGLRAGIIAAVVTAVALLIAMFVPIPSITLAIYALVVAWSAAVYFLGAKITQRTTAPGWLSQAAGQATSWVNKLIKKS